MSMVSSGSSLMERSDESMLSILDLRHAADAVAGAPSHLGVVQEAVNGRTRRGASRTPAGSQRFLGL